MLMEASSATTAAAFSRKEIKSQNNSDMGSRGQGSLAVVRRSRRQERQGRIRKSSKSNAAKKVSIKEQDNTNSSSSSSSASTNAACDEEDDKAEVENRIIALQKIVPGGESLGVDKLFEETAGYIMELQYQVKALKFLASLVGGADKEKRKLGG